MSRLWTTRRAVLTSMGGTAAALVAGLPLSAHQEARAAGAPRRLVILYSGNGTIRDAWLPTLSGANLELSPILRPFEPHVADMVVVDGLAMYAGGAARSEHHLGFGCLLTGEYLVDAQFLDNQGSHYGAHGGPTVDQIIADALQPSTPYRTLELGVQAGKQFPSTSMSKLAARGPSQLLPPENDPFRMFDRVFGGSRSPDELAAIRTEKASVLDFAREDLQRIVPRLSSEERERLEIHVDAVRNIERRLQAPLGQCGAIDPGARFDVMRNDRFPDVAALQLDLLATALACDQTRISTFMFSESTSQTVYRWLGATSGHHDLSHAGDADVLARDQLVAINTWIAEQISGFASRLQSLPDSVGSVYDNTLIVWVNDLGKGNVHSLTHMPVLLLGGAGGAVRGEQLLTYDLRWHNDLLLTLCHAMGVERGWVGARDANDGVLSEILAS